MQRGETNCVDVSIHPSCRQAVKIGACVPHQHWQQLPLHIPWLRQRTHCAMCQQPLAPGEGSLLVIHAESGIIWSYA